jgi:hypothetical protein
MNDPLILKGRPLTSRSEVLFVRLVGIEDYPMDPMSF